MGNGFTQNIRYLFNCVLALVYSEDEHCIVCGDYLSFDSYLCHKCLKEIRLCEAPFYMNIGGERVKFISLGYYSHTLKELVLRLKYKNDFRAGEQLGIMMAEVIMGSKEKFDIVTYVPLAKDRLKKRGYNQSQCMAKYISEKLGIKLCNCLKKIRKTEDQIGLDKEKRWNNIKGSIEIRDKKIIKNKKILLVDDVVTTGATTYFSVEQLIKNGSGKITVLTAAKSGV